MPNCDAGLVSVLMSVYNGAPTLEKAAASVLAQTYRDLELILCDDASTDDTWRIMQRIAAQDARVTIFQNKTNLGLGASLNECLARAQGAYIARQDADDVSDSDRIERTMDFLLSSGAKGKRLALPHSEIMIHQPLGGAKGQATDIQIQAEQILHIKKTLNGILAANTGKPLEIIERDTDRDNYMTAQEAMEYGLIDRVIEKRA